MRTIDHPVSVQPAMPDRPGLAPRTAFVLADGAILEGMQVRMLYECRTDLSWAPPPAR
jgi:hypothetical protein